jgi:hypothetical protein
MIKKKEIAESDVLDEYQNKYKQAVKEYYKKYYEKKYQKDMKEFKEKNDHCKHCGYRKGSTSTERYRAHESKTRKNDNKVTFYVYTTKRSDYRVTTKKDPYAWDYQTYANR